MYNPMTADEPDDSAGLREDEIERQANCLMDDSDWVEARLDEGVLDCRELALAVAREYSPGNTHALVGGLLIDALWKLAKTQAEYSVDNPDYDGD